MKYWYKGVYANFSTLPFVASHRFSANIICWRWNIRNNYIHIEILSDGYFQHCRRRYTVHFTPMLVRFEFLRPFMWEYLKEVIHTGLVTVKREQLIRNNKRYICCIHFLNNLISYVLFIKYINHSIIRFTKLAFTKIALMPNIYYITI